MLAQKWLNIINHELHFKKKTNFATGLTNYFKPFLQDFINKITDFEENTIVIINLNTNKNKTLIK